MPKLRFPEFLNNGEWKTNTLDEIAEFLKGKGISKADVEEKGTLPCIRYGELYTHYKEVIKEIKSFTNLSEDDLVLSEEDDVIIPSSGETKEDIATASCVKIKGVALGGDLNILRSKLDGEFLAYYLSHGVKKSISKIAQGDAVVHLYSTQLKKISIKVPPKKEEQQKIASCLSSIDEVITVESHRLDVLKEHKKGLLQNLLPQEGETAPKFRFKEFVNSGDWVETTLTQVADYENGKAHEQDIVDDGKFIVVNSKFISQDGEVKKFTNTAFCPATKGDVLMVLSDIPKGKAIAKCFFVEEDNRYTVNQRICRITPRYFDSKILYYLLNRNPYFLAFDDGVKQTNLRKEDVLNCPLLIPSDPKEQQKIADTLSSLDELINTQNQKIESLKLHKKGLLQGLFPITNNEV